MEHASSEKELYRKDNSGRGDNGKLYLVLLVAAICFAFAAFVIAIVSLSKQTGSSASPSVVNVGTGLTSADYDNDDKVWIIHGGHAGYNQYYISEETGKLEGFTPDIINAVCRIANKNCKITADLWSNCWSSEEGEASRGGYGLMAGWYDACSGYRANNERRRTFAFSDQVTKPTHQAFVTLPGNPKNFDWRNITGKTICFMNLILSNEDCLAEAEGIVGAVVPPENIRRVRGLADCLPLMKDGTIDAMFGDSLLFRGRPEIEEVTDHLEACPISGNSMMTRYDSKLIDWWNPAQAKLLASKEYHEICNDIKVTHGHKRGYDPEDFCINY
ncbi:uncharacterized protein [Amphiura filiformis]|uniref:uncharacterized protein n=1 Tax=Amphiura filiformis TaxID=82378 RepID=UPI003B218360